jgi:hypothetical protein
MLSRHIKRPSCKLAVACSNFGHDTEYLDWSFSWFSLISWRKLRNNALEFGQDISASGVVVTTRSVICDGDRILCFRQHDQKYCRTFFLVLWMPEAFSRDSWPPISTQRSYLEFVELGLRGSSKCRPTCTNGILKQPTNPSFQVIPLQLSNYKLAFWLVTKSLKFIVFF